MNHACDSCYYNEMCKKVERFKQIEIDFWNYLENRFDGNSKDNDIWFNFELKCKYYKINI